MAKQSRTTTSRAASRTSKPSSGRQLSDKALAMRKARIAKEEEQKKKLVYMIVVPGFVLIVLVLIIKAFSGGGDSKPAVAKRVVKKQYGMASSVPDGARPGLKKAYAILNRARAELKEGQNSDDPAVANATLKKVAADLEGARDMVEKLAEKYPGRWSDSVMQRINTLIYSSKKSTGFNYY